MNRMLVALAVLMSGLFVYFWDISFTSDYALIGLMAKHTLETGDLPLFVWSVGYMGMLIDGPLAAVSFRIFGVNPQALHLAAAFEFLILMGLVFKFFERVASRETAQWSMLFLLLSSPYFYGKVLRLQPNYTVIFIFGFLLFYLLDRSVDLYRSREKNPGRWTAMCIGIGLLCGFALYTYRQFYYFLATGALWLGAYALQREYVSKRTVSLRTLLIPYKGSARILNFLQRLNLIHLILSLFAFFLSIDRFEFAGRVIKFGPMSMLRSSAVALGLFQLVARRVQLLEWIKDNAKSLIYGGLAFTLGYSPKLVQKYVQGTVSMQEELHSGLWSTFGPVAQNLRVAWVAFKALINWNSDTSAFFVLSACTLVFTLGAVTWILGWHLRNAYLLTKRGEAADHPRDSLPLMAILPGVVLVLFVCSRAVRGVDMIRYFVIMQFVFAYALGASVVRVKTWITEKSASRGRTLLISGLLCGVTLILTQNTLGFVRAFKTSTHGALWTEIAQEMKAKGVDRGYAEYWTAYILNFLTHDQIGLEPLVSRYSPHYAEQVKQAGRIAYIDTVPTALEFMGERKPGALIKIEGQTYVLESERAFAPHPDAFLFLQSEEFKKREAESGLHLFVLKKI